MVDKTDYIVFFTAKTLLLKVADNITHLCADATYKVNIEGCQLIIIGTTSFTKFYPLCFALTRNEKKTSYQFVFKSLKDSFQELLDRDLQIDMLMADAADSITDGFKKIFGNEAKRAMCFPHLLRNIRKNPAMGGHLQKREVFLFFSIFNVSYLNPVIHIKYR